LKKELLARWWAASNIMSARFLYHGTEHTYVVYSLI
jgi:hypothetical protein